MEKVIWKTAMDKTDGRSTLGYSLSMTKTKNSD